MYRSPSYRLLPLGVLILLGAAACGGGGVEPDSDNETISIPVADDGVVTASRLHTWDDPRAPLPAVWVGDDAQDGACRGLFRFPLADIPADATVIGAYVAVPWTKRLGNPGSLPPHTTGDMIGDLGTMEWHRLPGTPLDPADFDAPSEAHDPESDLPVDFPSPVWPVGALEALRSAMAAGDTHLKLRAQYSIDTDEDGDPDQIHFGSRGVGNGAILDVVIRLERGRTPTLAAEE